MSRNGLIEVRLTENISPAPLLVGVAPQIDIIS